MTYAIERRPGAVKNVPSRPQDAVRSVLSKLDSVAEAPFCYTPMKKSKGGFKMAKSEHSKDKNASPISQEEHRALDHIIESHKKLLTAIGKL